MRRPEGHNINNNIRKKSLQEEVINIIFNKPEKLEDLDQQKPEGSEVQKAGNITNKHEHDNNEHMENRQRRMRQKLNTQNLMSLPKTYEDKKYRRLNKTNRRGGGATQDCDRRPLPRLRQKERAQGNWVGREQTKHESCYRHKHKLARVWTGTLPSGEPGEPRWFIAKQRIPSLKPEVEVKEKHNRQEPKEKQKLQKRYKKRSRYDQKENKTPHEAERRKEIIQKTKIRDLLGETGGGWPPKPDNLRSNPQTRLLKTRKMKNRKAAPKTIHTQGPR